MMKCGHCLEEFPESWADVYLGYDEERMPGEHYPDSRTWVLRKQVCPKCNRMLLVLRQYAEHLGDEAPQLREPSNIKREVWVLPKSPPRVRLPDEVPAKFAEDYKEASLVLADSPKASAALSRRCLQRLIREHLAIKEMDLNKEIQKVLEKSILPSHLAKAIDAVRAVGNFAAHPVKSEHTGEIIDVEPGEAEWLLETLEALFDFLFVQPASLEKKRLQLNIKLGEAGKPPIK